jgi:hypothetical protein
VKTKFCSEESDIVREILSYLIDHPDAQDTLGGIIEWWMLERKIRHQKNMVKEALTDLVKRGFILEHKMGSSETSYKINNKSTKKIMEFLKKDT